MEVAVLAIGLQKPIVCSTIWQLVPGKNREPGLSTIILARSIRLTQCIVYVMMSVLINTFQFSLSVCVFISWCRLLILVVVRFFFWVLLSLNSTSSCPHVCVCVCVLVSDNFSVPPMNGMGIQLFNEWWQWLNEANRKEEESPTTATAATSFFSLFSFNFVFRAACVLLIQAEINVINVVVVTNWIHGSWPLNHCVSRAPNTCGRFQSCRFVAIYCLCPFFYGRIQFPRMEITH